MNHLGTPRVAKHAGLLHVRISCALALLTFTLTACGGGGGAGSVVATTTQQVTGTLGIGTAQAVTLGNRLRKPAYVSGSTTNARLFINGGASAANSSTTCTPASGTAGTGTACTITWSTSLAVPASYTFAVEVDDGTTVLAEGSATEAIVAGNNTLSTLTLNGVVAKASFVTLSCVAGTAGVTPGTCNGAVILEDADSNTIEYNGPSTTVVAGNNPTTGTVFDNAPPATPVTLAASNGNGLVIGTAESYGAGPYVLSTFAANTLSISGVTGSSATPANAYTYEVQCKTASTSGTFGITVGGGTTPSGDVTAGELGALTYPASITTVATAPSYTCTNGVISSATGTLPIN
jgi:hypothetical protein